MRLSNFEVHTVWVDGWMDKWREKEINRVKENMLKSDKLID